MIDLQEKNLLLPQNTFFQPAVIKFSETLYEQNFNLWYAPLCRYAYNILEDRDEAEEMVQTVFCKWWEKRETLKISTSVKAYLYRAVYHASINSLKHEDVKHTYKQFNAMQLDNNPAYASEKLAFSELESELFKAIEKLPEQCKKVFTLSRFEELKYAEIAEHLQISIKTVENHMGKALRILRNQLADYLPLIFWLFYGFTF